MTTRSHWLTDEVRTPALVVDLEVLDENLDEMAALARDAGVELLPHAKTHRMPDAGVRQLRRGADGLCVAKLGEAEMFADAGIPRLLVAYPVAGPGQPERALALHRRQRVDLTLGTDGVPAAAALGAVFHAAGETASLLLAVDSGLGREGVSPEAAPDVAAAIAALDGVRLVGIYTHEGTAYGAANRAELVERSVGAARGMVEVAERIRARGVAIEQVSMGASASARLVAGVEGVTQIRPGIYAFNDVGQLALGNATVPTVAVRVIATVVSHPEPGRACIDAGSKALSADLVLATAHRTEYPGHGLIVEHPGWVIESVSEEHGWLRWRGAGTPPSLPVGSRLEIIPNHVCMAFAMLRKATLVRDGAPDGVWLGPGPGVSE